ncbi:MAG: Cof-type HAD-IIB family hydrolase [Erysipelotrichaceae bacterium]|nr:Cof-type HAD-IIB family hydrolase [Erysipelotrichaceae bacterium]
MVKAIFFDVDGTIISYENGKIPQSTRDVIEQLRNQGILCVLATGRSLMELEDLDIKDMEFDAYIMLNGQLCFDKDKKVMWGVPIPEEDFKRGLEMFNRKEMPLSFVEVDQLYNNFIDETVVIAQAAISSPLMEVCEYTGNEVYQIAVFAKPEMENYLKQEFPNCKVTKWNTCAFDVIAKTGGKVWGIQEYCKKMNISQHEIMTFGDGENDIEMLEYAYIGVAMGNANEEVKAVADYVTNTVDEDGILHALEHFGVL